MKSVKDPVCGMSVSDNKFRSTLNGVEFFFCSDYCRKAFDFDPAKYTSVQPATTDDAPRRVAYFSMELAIDSRIPTYSGGLGVLAGDTLKSCADLNLPVVGVSLLYKHGYFDQQVDNDGNQSEKPVVWQPSDFAHPLPTTTQVSIEARTVTIQAWRYDLIGIGGHRVPLILLDTDLDQNAAADRELTGWLYGGDQSYRLAQEIILGIGGVRMLRALGYTDLRQFHMNEGHAALLVLELLNERGGPWDYESVRRRCVFTTHTPVPAGHDQFPYDLVKTVLTEPVPIEPLQMLGGSQMLNMTRLAMNASHYINGVAKRHGEVSREMFAGYPIDSITNGVHSRTWTCPSFQRVFDYHIPGWLNDPFTLRHAISIPKSEIWDAHVQAKWMLTQELERRGIGFNTEDFTIGFARRATPYKRPELLLSDMKELIDMAKNVGPIQIIYAGKAHPKDEAGKDLIRRIVKASKQSDATVRIFFLENYDMALAQLLTAGVDLWLNTPQRPLEASGTSGMKSAHNGVPSFSVLDGWWIEGHIEGVTGWSIGSAAANLTEANASDAGDLYRKLRAVIMPLFYTDRDRWTDIMRQTIAYNASFFNTHRMVQQYAANAYV